MPANRKVIWAEGILLGQQHFQLWDNYLHHQQRLLQHHTLAYNWGIAHLEVDESFLPQGLFQLNRCVALLEDGRWIDFNPIFDKPLTIEIPDNCKESLAIFLTLPTTESVAGITGYPPVNCAAWEGDYKLVRDQYDQTREREVLLGEQQLRLVLDDTSQDGLARIKIAELDYDLNQLAYKVSHHFYPPVLKIGASHFLTAWLADFTSVLMQHIKTLNEQKAKHRHAQNQFGYSDFIYFNLIKTLTSHLPKFSHLQHVPLLHPFHLYEACLVLIGELWGYLDAPLSEPALPTYRHNDLAVLFKTLKKKFNGLMEDVMPVNTINISLERISETQYQSVTIDAENLKIKQFCLAVYHEDMNQTLLHKILAQVKIAAPSQLTHIVTSFTEGIEFKYLTAPGKDLMAKRHYHYFLLNKHSQGWNDVLSEQQLAFFVSQEMTSLSFELITYL